MGSRRRQVEDADDQRDRDDARPGQERRQVEEHRRMSDGSPLDPGLRVAGCGSVQRPVDLFGQLARDAVDRWRCPRRSPPPTPRTPPKRCSSRARFFGADAGDVLELAAADAHLRAPRAHAGDREAVRLVADLRDQHQRRRIAAEVRPWRGRRRRPAPRGRPCGPRPSRRRRSATRSRPSSANTSRAMLDLALAAVDQHQVGQARALPPPVPACIGRVAARFDELRVAAHQHLAHRRVVVARRDAVDVVAAVFASSASCGARRPRTTPASPRPPCG